MSYQCPKCFGVLYDRRRKTCGFCGVELPAELVFSEVELEQLRREESRAEERHKLQRAADAEEAEAQSAAGTPLWIPPISGP